MPSLPPSPCTNALLVGALVWLSSGCATTSGSNETLTRKHANGQLMLSMEQRDGVPHGRVRRWHANGERAVLGSLADGKEHGLFEYYGEDGKLTKRSLFRHGELLWESTDSSAPLPTVEDLEYASPSVAETQVPARFSELDLVQGSRAVSAQFSYHGARKRGDVSQHSIQRMALFAEIPIGIIEHEPMSAYLHVARVARYELAEIPDVSRSTFELGVTRRVLERRILARVGLATVMGRETLQEYVGALAGSQHRNADLALLSARSISLRSSASYFQRRGLFNVRIDGGLDQTVDAFGNSDLEMQDNYLAQLRANGGFGFGLEHLAATLQFVVSQSVVGESPIDSDFAAVGAASLEARREGFYGRLSGLIPFDGRPFTIALGVGYE